MKNSREKKVEADVWTYHSKTKRKFEWKKYKPHLQDMKEVSLLIKTMHTRRMSNHRERREKRSIHTIVCPKSNYLPPHTQQAPFENQSPVCFSIIIIALVFVYLVFIFRRKRDYIKCQSQRTDKITFLFVFFFFLFSEINMIELQHFYQENTNIKIKTRRKKTLANADIRSHAENGEKITVLSRNVMDIQKYTSFFQFIINFPTKCCSIQRNQSGRIFLEKSWSKYNWNFLISRRSLILHNANFVFFY